MIIRNLFEAPYKLHAIHDGKGRGKDARVFDARDFDTPLKFINYAELEPSASIGDHPHGSTKRSMSSCRTAS
jgi:hypothetical protein